MSSRFSDQETKGVQTPQSPELRKKKHGISCGYFSVLAEFIAGKK